MMLKVVVMMVMMNTKKANPLKMKMLMGVEVAVLLA